MLKYPAETNRNSSIESAKKTFEHKVRAEESEVWIAGRIIGILDDGFVLQDESGRMDIRYKEDINVGDIAEVKVACSEEVVNDQTVIFYFAGKVQILAPCKVEFFIKKEDPNYLRTVIDLNLKDLLSKRAWIIRKVREFFEEREFLEVDTPQLVKLPGMEPYLDVFKTQFKGVGGDEEDMYLITSPEYAMKKLLTAGHERIFQICKSFRNKETDGDFHNPEFTLLEWYRAYASYLEIMEDTESMINSLAKFINGTSKIFYQGNVVDTSLPWPRMKVKDAFKKYAGIEISEFENIEKFRKIVAGKGYEVDEDTPYDTLFFNVFMNEIEPHLGIDAPVILYEYPVQMAALAKKCGDDSRYAERFEVYIAGVELCNAFTELNDPKEQKKRLKEEREERQKLGKDDYPVDHKFIDALKFGMPPSGGIALGIDRLVMLLTDTSDIKKVLPFPYRDL